MKKAVGRFARRFGYEEELARAYRKVLGLLPSSSGGGEQAQKVLPENMIWIFGTGRSGSTWISRMMRDLRGYTLWNEPLVGHMLGDLYHNRGSEIQHLYNFLLGGDESLWLPAVREFILSAATAKFPQNAGHKNRFLVVKEPHGSIGADIISRALPEIRMVLLVRDPRDVTASKLDAKRPGSWAKKGDLYQKLGGDETAYVNFRAHGYTREMDRARAAYDAHPGPKTIVRYEDVRADPEEHLKKLMRSLDLPLQPANLPLVVQKHDWSNVPQSEKGAGKIRRRAKPGGWQEDLTKEQAMLIEAATYRYLDEFYPDFPRVTGSKQV